MNSKSKSIEKISKEDQTLSKKIGDLEPTVFRSYFDKSFNAIFQDTKKTINGNREMHAEIKTARRNNTKVFEDIKKKNGEISIQSKLISAMSALGGMQSLKKDHDDMLRNRKTTFEKNIKKNHSCFSRKKVLPDVNSVKYLDRGSLEFNQNF